MNGKSFSLVSIGLCTTLMLGFCLFGDAPALFYYGFFSPVGRAVLAALRGPQTQWLIWLCICFYFIILTLLHSRQKAASFLCPSEPGLWLIGALSLAAFFYVVAYSDSMQSTQLITLFASAALGKGASVCAGFKGERQRDDDGIKTEYLRGSDFVVLVASLLAILLTLASVWHPSAGRRFEYHGIGRWSGFWSNPNTFGLLMGTGAALAVGIGIRGWSRLRSASPRQGMEDGGSKTRSGVWHLASGKYTLVTLCLIAACLMGRGLLHSYSRGAWVATFC